MVSEVSSEDGFLPDSCDRTISLQKFNSHKQVAGESVNSFITDLACYYNYNDLHEDDLWPYCSWYSWQHIITKNAVRNLSWHQWRPLKMLKL